MYSNPVPVFRVHIHLIWIRPKILVRTRRPLNPDPSCFLTPLWININFFYNYSIRSQKKLIERYDVLKSEIIWWWVHIFVKTLGLDSESGSRRPLTPDPKHCPVPCPSEAFIILYSWCSSSPLHDVARML